MAKQTAVNPAEETIRIGPLGIRFLLSGDDTNGSVSVMGPAYFREAKDLVNAAAAGPPDTAKIIDLFRRHGMTIAAPPTR